MSRSKKKSPYSPFTTANSEKEDKQLASRRDRRVNAALLKSDEDDEALVNRKSTSDVWAFDKDGKRRVDPNKEPKALRK